MMIHEFTQRTKYEPTFEEYHYIEESYYEFDGNKDEFCKAWLKDKKSGAWAKELKLRMMIDAQKAEYEAKIAEQEENLEFYRKQFGKLSEDHVTITIKMIDEHCKRVYENSSIHFIDNGTIQYYNIKNEYGWMNSFRVDKIESLEVKIK